MVAFLFGFIMGAANLGVVEYQTLYCDCFRNNFSSEQCIKIKGNGSQGSCHK